jgi:transposase
VVKAALEARLDRKVSEMYVHDVLKRHGWRKVDPRPHHPKYNIAIQNDFKDKFSAHLEELVAAHPLRERPLMFMVQDEARFGRISETYSCWAPPGVRPEVAVQRVRQSFYLYGAFAPVGGQIEALLLPKANTEMMSLFLDYVSGQHDEKLIVMMCDRASWHRSHALKVPENMVLLAIPAVSPELNPAETMWAWIRENHLGNKFFDDLQGAEDAVVDAFLELDSHQYYPIYHYPIYHFFSLSL